MAVDLQKLFNEEIPSAMVSVAPSVLRRYRPEVAGVQPEGAAKADSSSRDA